MKRRLFLQRAVLPFLGVALFRLPAAAKGRLGAFSDTLSGFMAGSSAAAQMGRRASRHSAGVAKTVVGKVTASGKPLAGVVVSDGFSVVATGADGGYTFLLNPAATSVFVSVPAGYHFPADRSICRHYVPVRKLKDSVDFELAALGQEDSAHTFILWADPQVKTEKDVERMMATSVPDVRDLLKTLAPGTLVHGIAVGDLTWDNHALFMSYEEAVHKMNIPFFQCIGNHDMDYNMGGDDTSDDTFQELYGPTYYSFNRGKAHYIVMDNVRYLGKDRDYDGYITDEQLAWLEKDLALAPKDSLFLLCMHIPLHKGVKNNDALYPLLKGLNAHILSGHTHYHENLIRKGIYEHNHGTVCGAWWTGPVCSDGTPMGYSVYKVNGADLSWQYKSTGYPLDHQLVVYTNKSPDGAVLVTANVWDADPEWSVTVYADGQALGEMEAFKGYDPTAYNLYMGPDKPVNRKSVEPSMTDHMYSKAVPAGTKKVRVEAVSRFGQMYSSEAAVR